MKHFYFTSNGDIKVHAKLSGAYKRSDGKLIQPQFDLLGIECGDPNGKFSFPYYWWNQAKACGGYFHLVKVEDFFEQNTLWPDGTVLSKAEPHQQDETEDFFCDMELGHKHYPDFPIRLPSFGQSAKDKLWSKESIRRWEYKSGEKVIFTDRKTLDEKDTEI